TGDPRSRGTIMAETLVERVTGRAFADDVDVEVQVVMDADTVFNGGDTPADLVGYGPPAADATRARSTPTSEPATAGAGNPGATAASATPTTSPISSSVAPPPPTTAKALCKRSHSIKHQPGWHVTSSGKATIWRTPTGHEYRSDPPPVLPRDNNPGHLRQ
ncbi:MAG: endonuclease, partial [Aeromicrobium sp.]|nr:endonuclease [Aeromicrobium sp.]